MEGAWPCIHCWSDEYFKIVVMGKQLKSGQKICSIFRWAIKIGGTN